MRPDRLKRSKDGFGPRDWTSCFPLGSCLIQVILSLRFDDLGTKKKLRPPHDAPTNLKRPFSFGPYSGPRILRLAIAHDPSSSPPRLVSSYVRRLAHHPAAGQLCHLTFQDIPASRMQPSFSEREDEAEWPDQRRWPALYGRLTPVCTGMEEVMRRAPVLLAHTELSLVVLRTGDLWPPCRNFFSCLFLPQSHHSNDAVVVDLSSSGHHGGYGFLLPQTHAPPDVSDSRLRPCACRDGTTRTRGIQGCQSPTRRALHGRAV